FATPVRTRLLAAGLAEIELALRILPRKENAPTIFGHADIVELGPALGIDAVRGAQIDQRFLEAFRPHVVPPVEIAGMPSLQRLEHLAVLGEVDVVRDLC